MFIGREKELELLREKNWRDKAQLIAIYGRRRVGKTALVEKAYERCIVWKFEGIENAGLQKQIQHFLYSLAQYSRDSSIIKPQIKTWEEALSLLDKKIKDQELIVFFDEFQWIASMRKTTVSIFKWAWDNLLSRHKKCKFILCGSVSSFMVKKVLRSNALYGRIDQEIHLMPLSLDEAYRFFDHTKTKQETMDIYLTVGGIPQYLLELNPNKSYTLNLDSMAFSPNGYFFKEYQRLFISHFAKNNKYEQIINVISKRGIATLPEIAGFLKLKIGGTLSHLIEDLELADFIERFSPLDKKEKSRLIKFRIKDEFLNFYFSFIKNNLKAIEKSAFKGYEVFTSLPFYQWRGYSFERLCRNHYSCIAKKLGFSGIRYECGAWFRAGNGNKAQVDLLFRRADNVFTVCEVKYVNKLNTTTITDAFEKKLEALRQYYNNPIQKVLILGSRIKLSNKITGYFDSILFAEDLFFS